MIKKLMRNIIPIGIGFVLGYFTGNGKAKEWMSNINLGKK